MVVKNPRIIAAPYQGALNLRIRRGRGSCENPRLIAAPYQGALNLRIRRGGVVVKTPCGVVVKIIRIIT